MVGLRDAWLDGWYVDSLFCWKAWTITDNLGSKFAAAWDGIELAPLGLHLPVEWCGLPRRALAPGSLSDHSRLFAACGALGRLRGPGVREVAEDETPRRSHLEKTLLKAFFNLSCHAQFAMMLRYIIL